MEVWTIESCQTEKNECGPPMTRSNARQLSPLCTVSTWSCYGPSVICPEFFLCARTSIQMLQVWFQNTGSLGSFRGLDKGRLPSESSSDFAVRQSPAKLQFLAWTLLWFPGSLQQEKVVTSSQLRAAPLAFSIIFQFTLCD